MRGVRILVSLGIMVAVVLTDARQEEPTTTLFRLADRESLDGSFPAIPFRKEWLYFNFKRRDEALPLPDSLLPPSFLRVYEVAAPTNQTRQYPIEKWAKELQIIADTEISEHGAILFRNLPFSAKEFRQIWNNFSWPHFRRMDPYYDRFEEEGIHLAPRAYPERVVEIHNEQVYNPRPPKVVVFYALQAAEMGGETLLARNDELTQNISPWIRDLVKDDGGVMYNLWRLFDRRVTDNPDKHAKSWQHKTGLQNFDEAIQFLIDFGFNETDIRVDEEGTIHIKNISPNFFHDGERDLWQRSISFRDARRLNGEDFPERMRAELELAEWNSSSAVKLNKGDFLVLDNLRVAHGRLPYQNGRDQRKILTAYS